MNKFRIFSIINFIGIILYGVFKLWLLNFFSETIIFSSSSLGIDITKLQSLLNNYSINHGSNGNILGWLLYYPSYLLFHITFIFLLFKNQPKTRNILIVSLISLIAALVILSILGKLLGIEIIYQLFYYTFQQLFGLPFILLAIEGGKILYNDINKILNKSD